MKQCWIGVGITPPVRLIARPKHMYFLILAVTTGMPIAEKASSLSPQWKSQRESPRKREEKLSWGSLQPISITTSAVDAFGYQANAVQAE